MKKWALPDFHSMKVVIHFPATAALYVGNKKEREAKDFIRSSNTADSFALIMPNIEYLFMR